MTTRTAGTHELRSATWGSAASIVAAAGALLLPKCPLCFLAYASALSASGLDVMKSWWAMRSAVFAAGALSIAVVSILSAKRRDPIPLVIALSGAAVFAAANLWDLPTAFEGAGAAGMVAAAWLNSMRCRSSKASRLAG